MSPTSTSAEILFPRKYGTNNIFLAPNMLDVDSDINLRRILRHPISVHKLVHCFFLQNCFETGLCGGTLILDLV